MREKTEIFHLNYIRALVSRAIKKYLIEGMEIPWVTRRGSRGKMLRPVS